MRNLTFAVEPCRLSRTTCRPEALRSWTPPQSTRCSRFGISAFPQLGYYFPERNGSKPFDCLGCEALTLVNVLAVPATGEAFNNPRRLSTMPNQSLVKLGALTVIGEPLLDANVVR